MAGSIIGQSLTRREFNAASVSALFVGMTVWMSGCGGGSSASPASPSSSTGTPSGSPGTPSAGAGDKTATISANHGHVATVTSAVLQAGGAVTLNIRGTADHDHSVQLTQDQVRLIAGGSRVSSTSSDGGGTSDGYGGTMGGHAHSVTFN